jgi:hypothetical protein
VPARRGPHLRLLGEPGLPSSRRGLAAQSRGQWAPVRAPRVVCEGRASASRRSSVPTRLSIPRVVARSRSRPSTVGGSRLLGQLGPRSQASQAPRPPSSRRTGRPHRPRGGAAGVQAAARGRGHRQAAPRWLRGWRAGPHRRASAHGRARRSRLGELGEEKVKLAGIADRHRLARRLRQPHTNVSAALSPPGKVSAQRARLCRLTLMCSKGDPHPTDAGYRAMANAFLAASGYPRR